MRKEQGPSNPVGTGFQFVEYLDDNPNATYDDLASDTGVTKARECHMISLCKRLPTRITAFAIDTHEPEIQKYFTERKLRPLTLLASNKDKIKKHVELMETIRKSRGLYFVQATDIRRIENRICPDTAKQLKYNRTKEAVALFLPISH